MAANGRPFTQLLFRFMDGSLSSGRGQNGKMKRRMLAIHSAKLSQYEGPFLRDSRIRAFATASTTDEARNIRLSSREGSRRLVWATPGAWAASENSTTSEAITNTIP